MKRRVFVLHPAARTDLLQIWKLVADNDGDERADGVLGRIEAFMRSLEEFSDIGTRHDDRRPGLRSCGVPGLKTASILFVVTAERVTVVRVGYLGRNVWVGLQEIR